ncbi:hypothetical protein [Tessaracoccus aquimaris]|uniref:hypothetical protein n=1 Tax=Tessaracoccus aquimaris TaxID=1332264 RepID=UPI001D048E3F|nr:hypothetical protein [Tessaracoccus aquimaris]
MRTFSRPVRGGLAVAASAALALSSTPAVAAGPTLRDTGPDRPLIGTAAWACAT